MELTFEQINEIVLEAIQPNEVNREIFSTVGKWYYRLIYSDENKLSLVIPFYIDGIQEEIVEYLYFFEIILKLSKLEPLNSFDETFLFDIFKYLSSGKNTQKYGDFKLMFQKEIDEIQFFGDSTVTKRSPFLPIFKSESTHLNTEEKEAIYKLFKLFVAIRKSSCITHPILIDIDQKQLSLISANKILMPPSIGIVSVISKGQTTGELRELITELREKIPLPAFSIFYPYNTGISSRIESALPKSRHFRIVFRNRFSYSVISDSDVQLLPTEFLKNEEHLIKKVSVQIINTKHSKELFSLFEELNSGWKNAQFNPYITPFPAKWFMSVHIGEELSYWKTQFEKDFRFVNSTLLSICLNIIEHLYKLNWVNQFISDETINGIILPTSKNHQEVINSFKNHINQVRGDIKFRTIDDFKNRVPESVLVLNCFNFIEIVNWCQRFASNNICITVPDFIYFNHYSFLQYGVLKYQYLAIKGGLRSKLDSSYNQLLWNDVLTKSLKEARSNLAKYISKYRDKAEIVNEELDIEGLDFSESEVLEIMDSKEIVEDTPHQLLIVTESGDEIKLSSQESVIVLDKGFVTTKNAWLLLEKDLFIPPFNLKNIVEIDLLIDKLSQMPEKGRTWQVQLNDRKTLDSNLYKVLISQGLDLREQQFETKYLKPSGSIDLPSNFPKKIKNWRVVSEFLGIPPHERDESWILYYGKSDLNKLKALYKNVLELLINENLFGQLENASVSTRVVDFVANSGCFNLEEMEMNQLDIAQSIMQSIHKHLNFIKVSRIKTLNNE